MRGSSTKHQRKEEDPNEFQEQVAHKVAWAAVEKRYKKNSDGKWMPV